MSYIDNDEYVDLYDARVQATVHEEFKCTRKSNVTFEEKYAEYLNKNKCLIADAIRKAYDDFTFKFNYSFQSNKFKTILYLVWFFCFGLAVSLIAAYDIIVFGIIFMIAWIGLGVWLWISYDNLMKGIADYFFYKYHYSSIIENKVKQDEQDEVQRLADEMFSKDSLSFVDLDTYKFKLEDIKNFYIRCLSELKNGDL